MNGQIVLALGEDADGEELLVETDAGERLSVPAERTHSLRPAYAISVHKSQGCEMPVVVVPVHASHVGLLSRNLLYTAVTRARSACVLVGQRAAVHAGGRPRRRVPAELAAGGAAGGRLGPPRKAADRIRTDDPVFTRDVLYQLSYGGVERHGSLAPCRPCSGARPGQPVMIA